MSRRRARSPQSRRASTVLSRTRRCSGAITLTRVAASHIRVGTFLKVLRRRKTTPGGVGERSRSTRSLDHYADSVGTGNDALALLERVIDAQADLVAEWLGVGFVHGVMNTDNTSISGETIDYGPCAFLDEYDPGKSFSVDRYGGRYAFSSQPRIALWNMARLAETLLPQISADAERRRAYRGRSLASSAPPGAFRKISTCG